MEAATMSKTLNLIDRLLVMGRNYHQLQQRFKAIHILGRLARFPDLPAAVAEETQLRLAELCLERHTFRRARHHLAALLRLCPDGARYHFLMATAIRRQKNDPERALRFYRKSLRLDPRQHECRSAYGAYLVRLGRVEAGLTTLRKAAELAPNDAGVIGRLVRGLRGAGAWGEARRVLIAARFRNPRDRRFRRLYHDFMFRQLRCAQQCERPLSAPTEDQRPVVLPFVRVFDEVERGPAEHKLIRLDPASSTPLPHGTARSARRSDWKHG
jgi:tetratricopeptide (TPR) repeat protein